MANQMFEAGSGTRIPFRGRQNAVERYLRSSQLRAANRITDPKLLYKVQRANSLVKRSVDFAIAALAGLFLLPAFLTIALLIKLTDRKGPVFYSHTRIGREGNRFECVKFRTMATDSQERLSAILASDPEAAAEWRASQKLRNDPRVTKIGAFLRKTSLDELPQIWNVLKGEMSVIGPRPITRAELNRYGKDRRYYLLVRPGITGLWQVSGRSSTGYEKRVEFDKAYLEKWSWKQELFILVMTLPAVLKTRDAC